MREASGGNSFRIYSGASSSSSSSSDSGAKGGARKRPQAGSKTISHATKAVFRKHENSSRKVALNVRVDTGASMTAIPHYLMKKLGLKPLRSVRIRTGTDQTQQRDVVMVNITFMEKSYNVEATVRRGKKLGMTPILGRNFLKLDSFRIVIPPSGSGSDSHSPSEENTSCSSSDSDADSLVGASTISTVSERSDAAIEMKDKVWVTFRKTPHSKERVRMQVRVDTGASMTAIPVAVARKLRLRSQGRVRVRLGTDSVDVRDVVIVNVEYEGKFYDVKASVRNGSKLGKTAILGRNLLNQDNFVIRVSDGR